MRNDVSGLLQGNTYRNCAIGIRLTSKNGTAAPCRVHAKEELLHETGDGIIIASPGCFARLVGCTMRHSLRCGVRIGHGARAELQNCNISWNGRGVAAAGKSSANILNCQFDGNIGWAVRLEDQSLAPKQLEYCDNLCGSVVSGNIFGRVQ